MKTFRANIFALLALSSSTTLVYADFDAARDFSPTLNPAGVWSYGWSQTLGSTFVYDLTHAFDPGSGLDVWNGSVASPLGNFPAVAHNGTGQPINVSTIRYAPGDLGLHPGPGGQYSIVRFIAPTSGAFQMQGNFRGLDVGPTTTDVHVLLNGTQIFGGTVSALASGPSFSTTLSLQIGDRLDFAVGFGSNGTYFNDTTGLTAQITPVPEPTSLLTFGLGGIALLTLARRRFQTISVA